MKLPELLRSLSDAPGPPGYEHAVAELIGDAWRPFVTQITSDRIGSLIALKEGSGQAPRPRLMLAAHMDEIAMIARKLVAFPDRPDGNGFIRVSPLGGVDIRHLYGQLVTVHGTAQGEERLTGIIGALPPPMLPDSLENKALGYDHLIVDVGLSYADLSARVVVGDVISFRQPMRDLLNNRITGKALDNRASVAAVAIALEVLHGRSHEWDVLAVATAQEETALLGAFTAGHSQRPDVAVAIDVTFGKGPGSSDEGVFELDEGPALGLGPNVHPGVYQALRDAAAAIEMKVHTDVHSRASGTDAFALQIAREGIPTGLVSIPLRYMHTMVESIALSDVERAGRLLGEFAARLDGGFLDEIARQYLVP
jgi:endoglucanase